jgi:hypothetical protein
VSLLIGRRFRRAFTAVLVAVPLVAVVGGGLSGPAAGKSSRTGRYWIVLGSNRSGDSVPYSVLSDGSRLTPLLAHGRGIQPSALSRDGTTIAYTARRGGATYIYVSRANGRVSPSTTHTPPSRVTATCSLSKTTGGSRSSARTGREAVAWLLVPIRTGRRMGAPWCSRPADASSFRSCPELGARWCTEARWGVGPNGLRTVVGSHT